MFTRTTGIIIVPMWLAAMSWLVAHDIWPLLTAQDPPPMVVTEWMRNEGRESQFAILFDDGQRLGTIWTTYLADEYSIRREDLVFIERFPLEIVPLRLIVESVYVADGQLDEFTARLENPFALTELHGERFHSDFSFTFEGLINNRRIRTAFKTPLIDGSVLSGAFNPFGQLVGLEVGQSWRMQVFNPLAALTGVGERFLPLLVKVTGRERIRSPLGTMDCFVVESPKARAWVDDRGVVIMQEVTLPMVGTLRIAREAGFDEDARAAVRQVSIMMQGGRS